MYVNCSRNTLYLQEKYSSLCGLRPVKQIDLPFCTAAIHIGMPKAHAREQFPGVLELALTRG
jgi:hypothetical protein